MQLSIIIPVYKVEKYIRGTLKSIYDQQCDENLFELIVVNDGTPDASMTIVTEFANSHTNLLIVNQENQGLSSARNAGLKIAQGEYVWFIDSDDTITEQSIEKVIGYAEQSKADVLGFCISKVKELNGDSEMELAIWDRQRRSLLDCPVDKKQVIFYLHTGIVQRYVFRREFLSHNGLDFYRGILHEDQEFLPRTFCLAKSFYISSFVSYRYLIRSSGSIMSHISIRSLYDMLTIVHSHETFLRERTKEKDATQSAYMNGCIFSQTYWLLAFKTVMFQDEQKEFMCKHYAEIRVKCLMAGWKSLKGYFKLTRIIRLMMVFFIPHHLVKK